MPLWIPIVAAVIGVLLILRAAGIVATKGVGRFRADPLVTAVLGFGLLLAAQYCFQR